MNELNMEMQLEYAREVLRFRKALNLTSISDEQVFMTRFVLPSVALVEWMPQKGRLLDVGSGMGVPGIPLLIARPSLHGVLVERRKKRAEFLRHVVRKLGLSAEVHDADINDLPDLGVDIVVARAVTRADDLLAMCRRHTCVGGTAVLPVPRDSVSAITEGWHLESESHVDAVEAQAVHCYRRDER